MSYTNVPKLYYEQLEKILKREIKDLHVENVAQLPDEFEGTDYLGRYHRACLVRCDDDETHEEKPQGCDSVFYTFRLRLALVGPATTQHSITDLAEQVKYVLRAEKHSPGIWVTIEIQGTIFNEISEIDLGNNIKLATITIRILRDG